jgi:DNA-directed RNA polymerase subunit K/omega
MTSRRSRACRPNSCVRPPFPPPLARLTARGPQKDKPATKTALEKLSHDFQLAVVAFQRAQQLSAERQRTVVQSSRAAADEAAGTATSPSASGGAQQQLQAQAQVQQLAPAEMLHQEQLIQERESEIRDIESGIHELHEIFRDINTLVLQQGDQLGTHPLPPRCMRALTPAAHRQHRGERALRRGGHGRRRERAHHRRRVPAQSGEARGVPDGHTCRRRLRRPPRGEHPDRHGAPPRPALTLLQVLS